MSTINEVQAAGRANRRRCLQQPDGRHAKRCGCGAVGQHWSPNLPFRCARNTAARQQLGDCRPPRAFDQRDVREWLGGLASAGIINYEAQSQTYTLPAHHAAALTRAGGVKNVAKVAQHVAVLGGVEQKIIDCFRNGGGLPYSEFPRFHAVRAEEARDLVDASLVDEILPLVEGLTEQLTTGVDVADFGCGSGHAINVIAQAFPSQPVHRPRLCRTRSRRGTCRGCAPRCVERDIPDPGPRGARRCGRVRRHHRVRRGARSSPASSRARNIHRGLRSGGTLLMGDIKASSHLEENIQMPLAPLFYTISTMHCMTVSLASGGTGLGTMWGQQLATSMLADAGFTDVEVREVETDPFNIYYIAVKR